MKNILNVIFVVCVALLISGCAAWHSGIKPISPPGKKVIPAPMVDSLTPTLVWEPLEIKESADKITDLRYDIIIYTNIGFPPQAKVAYQKEDITETSHVVTTPLQKGTRYYWRIREKYKRNGEEVTGQWNGFGFVAVNQYATNKPYFFDTP